MICGEKKTLATEAALCPVYRCRFVDRAGNPVMTWLASETDTEAVEMARNVSAISGPGGFEVWQHERCVHAETGDTPEGEHPGLSASPSQ